MHENIFTMKKKAKTSTKTQILPTYFRIYEQDTPALSSKHWIHVCVKRCSIYYFIYFKFGQQQAVTSMPISLTSTNLDVVIADPSQLLGASIHLEITVTHQHPRYSIFWSTQPTAEYLQGQNTKRYPFLGLSEIGNTISTFPRAQSFQQAIQRQDWGAIHLTYAQAYTPLTKSLENSTPFSQRPFLLTLLLGRHLPPEWTSAPLYISALRSCTSICNWLKQVFLTCTRLKGGWDATAVLPSRSSPKSGN